MYQFMFDKVSSLESEMKKKKRKSQHTKSRKLSSKVKPSSSLFCKAEVVFCALELFFWKTALALSKVWSALKDFSKSTYLFFTKPNAGEVCTCCGPRCYYKKFHEKTKRKVLVLATISTVFVSLIVALVFPGSPMSKAATNNWNQSDWSLGASISEIATHLDNQTNWQKFYSKDAVVDVTTTPGEVKLALTTSSTTETTTADFAAGTQSNTSASNNSVVFLKPQGGSCSANSECAGNMCLGGYCNNCGVFTDADSNTYYGITIGTQCWLSKNMNVGTMIAGASNQTNNATVEKYCYSDIEANCTTDGGLYQWDEAMAYAVSCNGTGESQPNCTTPVQGICPSGTHTPSHYEWTLLEKNVGSNPGAFPYDTTTAGWLGTNEGTNLKSSGSPYFTGVLAGYRNTGGSFGNRTTDAYLWSSAESGTSAWSRYLSSGYSSVYRYAHAKADGFSVRCLKN